MSNALDMPRVLVTGSRDLACPTPVYDALDAARAHAGRPIVVVHGACPTGADRWAQWWAEMHEPRGIRVESWPADWDTYGPAAGPRRNAAMVKAGAWRVYGFPIGDSPGTRDCLRRACAAGLHVITRELAPEA